MTRDPWTDVGGDVDVATGALDTTVVAGHRHTPTDAPGRHARRTQGRDGNRRWEDSRVCVCIRVHVCVFRKLA